MAVVCFFFANGAVFGSWAARLPAVQERLDLADAELGVALLGIGLGALVAMPPAGALAARAGSRHPTTVAAVAQCATLPLLATVPNLEGLIAATILFGIWASVLDLSMNAQAVAVERAYGRPIMSSFHGFFSVGGFAGAGGASLAVSLDLSLAQHFLVTAILIGGLALVSGRALVPDAESRAAPLFARPTSSLLALGAVAFCVLLSEGAVADWSAVYLHNVTHADPAIAALGFAMFSIAMTVGRLVGDRVTTRLGPVRVVRLGAAFAAAGLSIGLLVENPAVAIAGFVCVGLGIAVTFPLVMSASSRRHDQAPAAALAAVSTAGYTGFLVGPPLIGFIAGATNLRLGLSVVVVLCLSAVGLARTVNG